MEVHNRTEDVYPHDRKFKKEKTTKLRLVLDAMHAHSYLSNT